MWLPSTATAERRLVTILFADLTGFTALNGPVGTQEIDDVIARSERWGALADVGRFSMIAAPFTTSDRRAEYLSAARSIATERGWHGILRLIDSHLS